MLFMKDFLEIYTLGNFIIQQGGTPITEFTYQKELGLCVYLACTQQPHSRDSLAELLWNDRPQKRAQSNLRNLLTKLRRRLSSYLIITRQTVAFNSHITYWLDVHEFQHRLVEAKTLLSQNGEMSYSVATRLERTLTLYKGDFLAGFYVRQADKFEDWVTVEREKLHQEAIDGLQMLVDFYITRGELVNAIKQATQLINLEPLNEKAHLTLVETLARNGQREAALNQYENYGQVFETELGVPPSSEAIHLYQRLIEGQLPVEPDISILVEQTHLNQQLPNNIPYQTTSFIGRERTLAQLNQYLNQPNCRLLTIVGMGGIGKTRLALQSIRYQIKRFIDGIYFIPLTTTQQTTLLPLVVAQAIGMPLIQEANLKLQLFSYLRTKEILLIFDNFEHLTTGVTFIRALLEATSELKILITSRERLHLQAEYLLPLEGLPFPEQYQDIANISTLATRYGAVQLFMERAQAVVPDFELSQEVLQICHDMAGLPLGLELAATLVSQLSCADIIRNLNQDLQALKTDLHDIPARHQSLWCVFEQSWQLLSPKEQAVLADCAIFQAGFSHQAIKPVLQTSRSVIELFGAKSLLKQIPNRYIMHPLVQQFALEKLTANSSTVHQTKLYIRYATYYLELVARYEIKLNGDKPHQGVKQLEAEFDNIRQAWQWATNHKITVKLQQSCFALARYCALVGLLEDGCNMVEATIQSLQAINNPTPAEQKLLATLLIAMAELLALRGENSTALSSAQTAVHIAKQYQFDILIGLGYLEWGQALQNQGDYSVAEIYLTKAFNIAEAHNNLSLKANSLRHLGTVALRHSHYEVAQQHYQASLNCYQSLNDRQGKAKILNGLATVSIQQGDYNQAQSNYKQALKIYKTIADQRGQGQVLSNLGTLADYQQQFIEARNYYDQALQIFKIIGDMEGQANVLGNLGISCDYLGHYQAAQRYTKEALQLQTQIGAHYQIGMALANLSLHAHHSGDNMAAEQLSQQALSVAREVQSQQMAGYALMFRGHAQTALEVLDDALASYQTALSIWQMLEIPHLAIEALAGLVRVTALQGELTIAQSYVEEILTFLQKQSLNGTEEPLRIYFTCYQQLKCMGDDRAVIILEEGYQMVCNQAAQITDDTLRQAYLNNVRANRAIIAEWEQLFRA